MNRKYLYPILIVLVTVILYYGEKYVDRQKNPGNQTISNPERAATEFNDTFLPASTTGEIIRHNFYTLSYSEKNEQAEWVAYELNKKDLFRNDFKRPYFEMDPRVPTHSADWRNYKHSGYDRGHLCPAGDRRFSREAYDETFLTSNISPQDHDFNAGIWNRLEQKVRYWAKKYNGVYVVTGGILKGAMKTIGDEHVSVPHEFYKIVVDTEGRNYKAIAFLIPNRPSSESFYNYSVSIDEVEAKTGIDFFPQLPDSIENKMEATVDLKAWGRR